MSGHGFSVWKVGVVIGLDVGGGGGSSPEAVGDLGVQRRGHFVDQLALPALSELPTAFNDVLHNDLERD